MSNQNDTTFVEYREIFEAPGYRFGSDGSIWSRWKTGATAPIWPWHRLNPGPGKRGYLRANIRFNGKPRTMVYVHDMILLAFRGPKPPGLFVRHWDDNKLNNRIENLLYGTQQENVEDSRRNGTLAIGERRNSAKFTEDKVREIRRRHESGEGVTALAREHKVNHNAIACMVQRKTWKHVV